MGMESQATGKLHPWWKGGKVCEHFWWAKPLILVKGKSGSVLPAYVQSCWHPKQVRSEGRKISTVRRKISIAASLLYCPHQSCSALVLQCLTGFWVLHLSDSSISMTFMDWLGSESYCASLPWGLFLGICPHPKSDVIWREEGVLGSCRGDIAWLLQRWHTTGRPQLHFDVWLHCCQAPCSYFIPISA